VLIFFGEAAGLRVLRREGTGLFSFFLDFEVAGLFLAAAGIGIELEGSGIMERYRVRIEVCRKCVYGVGRGRKDFRRRRRLGCRRCEPRGFFQIAAQSLTLHTNDLEWESWRAIHAEFWGAIQLGVWLVS
jgi:hypothetical protein